ncbi:hypothetical protein ALC53_07894 [Atta colombica]|uniref:Uncharacterized protein n=1 Tax=Atta colombica TaxID=520822 RepID=A0A195BAD7_9HYME|nr:hypothetical protein ALC53_07894 [Atta colombica]
MSQQHPSRPSGGGHVPPGSWSGRSNAPRAPSPFRPASPYTPSSSPYPQGRIRGPPTPVHPAHPMSPLVYPGIMMHPMSPVPIGMPISPGMSPVFGCPTSGYIQCPRPRWPSPIPTGSQVPRPFIPTQSTSFRSDSASPIPCAPPEYLIAPYRSGNYEYVGVPLDHTQTDEESSGPSTAEIIASQSQDYVDEKLAEYQATIQQLQGEFYEAEEINSFCNEIVLITLQDAQWIIITHILL